MKKVMRKILSVAIIFAIVSGNISTYMPEKLQGVFDDFVLVQETEAAWLSVQNSTIDLVIGFEGFRSTCYRDNTQNSIGYGTKCGTGLHTAGTHSITQSVARTALQSHLQGNANVVNNFASKHGLTFNQNQFDALCSFVYNLGNAYLTNTGTAKGDSMRNFLTSKNWTSTRAQSTFGLYVNAGGVKQPGLVTRRSKEATLFSSNIPTVKTNRINFWDGQGWDASKNLFYSQDKPQGTPVKLAAPWPPRKGYTFRGWRCTKSNRKFDHGATYDVELTADVALVAEWEENTMAQPLITLTPNKTLFTLGEAISFTWKEVGQAITSPGGWGSRVTISRDGVTVYDTGESRWGNLGVQTMSVNHYVQNLTAGTYTIRVEAQRDNYTPSSHSVQFKITADSGITDITPTKYKLLLDSNPRKSPAGDFYYDSSGKPVVWSAGGIYLIDKICSAPYNGIDVTWGHVVNGGWDWIALDNGKATSDFTETDIGITDIAPTKYKLLMAANPRKSPAGDFYYDSSGKPVAWSAGGIYLIDKLCSAPYNGLNVTWGHVADGNGEWIALDNGKATTNFTEETVISKPIINNISISNGDIVFDGKYFFGTEDLSVTHAAAGDVAYSDGFIEWDDKGGFKGRIDAPKLIKGATYTITVYAIGGSNQRVASEPKNIDVPVQLPNAPNTNAISGAVDPTKQLNFTGYHDTSTYDLLINAYCDTCRFTLCAQEKIHSAHISSFWLEKHQGCTISVSFLHRDKNSYVTSEGNRVTFQVAKVSPIAKPIIDNISISPTGDIVFNGTYFEGTGRMRVTHAAVGEAAYSDGFIDPHGNGKFSGRIDASKLKKGVDYIITVYALGGSNYEIEVASDPRRIPVPNVSSENYKHPLRDSYRVSSHYGLRNCPHSPKHSGGKCTHSGVDFALPAGKPIYPTKSGKVITSTFSSSYGNVVYVDHGNGIVSLYAHMSKRNVSAGQSVNQNTVLGTVGSTGNSTGNHLHFEIRVNGSHKNPRNYIVY